MVESKAGLKDAIDKKASEIIGLVDEFASKNNQTITRANGGKRQFEDLVEAAEQACCIDEFKLYIDYKGAKKGTEKVWGSIANPFNIMIDRLCTEIANIVANEVKEDDETVRLEVLKRFCGYLMWRMHADISAEEQEKKERQKMQIGRGQQNGGRR